MHASPESTPALNVFDPNGPIWSLGLLGAKASSSIGLNTARVYLFLPRNRYVPLVPSSVRMGFKPLTRPFSISRSVPWSSCGHYIDPNISKLNNVDASWSSCMFLSIFSRMLSVSCISASWLGSSALKAPRGIFGSLTLRLPSCDSFDLSAVF